MAQSILQIFFLLILIYTGLITGYFFILALISSLRRSKKYSTNQIKARIAILIPAYREDSVIINTARMAANHNYPRHLYDVFIAADQLQSDTIRELQTLDVNVFEVRFEIGSKARSLNFLLNTIPGSQYELALILDADNILLPDALEKLNDAYQQGFRAVQLHRIAKNDNTSIAVLDGITEEINNTLFRKAQRALGFSANTIGSGMAFDFENIKAIYNKPGILSNPACDREVDFEIMKSGIGIEYIDDAYVLDEKVSQRKVFETQRTRWLESQITHLKLFLYESSSMPVKTGEYWNKLFTNLLPPRSFLLLIYILAFIVYITEQITNLEIISPWFNWWLALFVVHLATFLLAVPSKMYTAKTAIALIAVPVLLLSMIRAMLRINTKRKEFLHTPKSYSEK